MKKKSKNGEQIFLNITNKDIYGELQDLKKEFQEFKIENIDLNNDIIKKLDVYCKENEVGHSDMKGQINKNTWIGLTAISLSILAIGWFITHL